MSHMLRTSSLSACPAVPLNKGALAANHEILRKKRDEFVRRERDAELRRQREEAEARARAERKRQEAIARGQERQAKYQTAQELEEQRKKVGLGGWRVG